MIYEFLRPKRYAQVITLAQITTQLRMDWRKKEYVFINWAIALRELTEKMESVLEYLNQRKKHLWQIKLALDILQNNEMGARKKIEEYARKGKLRNEISLNWPLFNRVRDKTWFIVSFATRHDELPTTSSRNF